MTPLKGAAWREVFDWLWERFYKGSPKPTDLQLEGYEQTNIPPMSAAEHYIMSLRMESGFIIEPSIQQTQKVERKVPCTTKRQRSITKQKKRTKTYTKRSRKSAR